VTVFGSSAALANEVTCTGTMIEIDLDARAAFPYAVVYDSEAGRTCMLDRGPAGHDPLRGLCNAGESCTITGPYRRRIRETYFLNFADQKVRVEAANTKREPNGK
jgi:hypothetical protein